MPKWSRNLALLVVILVVLGLMVIYFLRFQSIPTKNLNVPSVSKIPPAELSKFFAFPIFMEQDARIVDSYMTSFKDGRVWTTAIYETDATLGKLKADYGNYLNSLSGWVAGKPYSRNGTFFMSATTAQNSLVIYFHASQNKARNMVTISNQTKK